MRFLLPIVALLFTCLIPAEGQIVGNSGGGWTIRGSNPIGIYYDGRHVSDYHGGDEEGKPFCYPVVGPTGENMTRHWPMKDGFEDEEQDHIHHRGMWFGLGKVNGLDFWHFYGDDKKQDKKFGKIIHKGMNGVKMGGDLLTFSVKSSWVSQEDQEKRICSDNREFNFYYRKDGALVVETKLKLNADAGDLEIKDDKEGAWSIRTIPTLRLAGDHAKGHILNSVGDKDRDAWGKRASWVNYFGEDRAGNAVGIAMIDHPTSFRHPTWWHARHYGLFTANPFGQGNFEKETEIGAGDYTIKAGDSITFRYLTIFYKGSAEEADIAAAFEKFSAR